MLFGFFKISMSVWDLQNLCIFGKSETGMASEVKNLLT